MSLSTTSNNERPALLQTLHDQIQTISKRKAAQAMQSTSAADSSDMMALRHAAMAFVNRICSEVGSQPLDMIPFWDFYFAVSKMERTVEVLTTENKRLSILNRRLAKAAC
ncbi:hypothetical protein [Massilia sp. TWR1-2-2]|uniref:hypothetical protein n=1 Tax=Massilia sp. TWR1-2-2 TaxID=2804584 RepID=UPI003CF21E02